MPPMGQMLARRPKNPIINQICMKQDYLSQGTGLIIYVQNRILVSRNFGFMLKIAITKIVINKIV